ncbi:DNA-binding LacI/PurR family transcriptional regulator [Neorhizobium sp. R1-B]|nr:DNA-binding LacI/PurR family transcriptional regulator [Neorhizobium sp. S3-V5DH]TDX85014.1 DNA-binding LacI/PurR family transcriptional regulator [Neorhizobium sp. R1-B]
MRSFAAFFRRFGWPEDKGRMPFCIGHRGASGHERENTLAAFRRAAELGAEMWELDTQMTADGVVVISHDDHLERVFAKDLYISQMSFAELRAIVPDVPSFEEVAELGRATGCGLYVELKRPGTGPVCWQHLKEMNQRFACLGSFDVQQVRELREMGCDFPLSVLIRIGHDPHLLGRESGADILHLCWEKASDTPQEFVTEELVEKAFSDGKEIVLWHEERSDVLKDIMAQPVLGICTDLPDLMRSREPNGTTREQRRVTSFDVARAAGVSRAAVSRAFTPDASVSEKTREKVYQAARELGYRVNYLARSLTNKRSDFVGLVAAGLDNPFRTQQLEHLARALIARNYRPILLPTSKEADTSTVIGQLLHYAVSGVIVTSDAPPSHICEECAAEGVPIVLINKGEDFPFVDRVVSDDRMSGYTAADHLLEVGAAKLAVVAGTAVSYSSRRRAEAFQNRCTSLGVEATLVPVTINDYRRGYEAAERLLNLGVDGVFSVNDYMACGVLDGLVRAGMGYGSVKVIGHDDIPQASWAAYDLTTFVQPCEVQAEQVIDLLISRMADPDAVSRVEFTPVTLIKRRSA